MVIVVVLFLLSVLRQTELVWNVVLFFKKCQNPETSRLLYVESILVIVQKTWFNMFLFWHFGLFYFFAQILAKKSVLKTRFLHIFAISDVLFDTIWHKRYYQHGLMSEKKYKKYFSLRKCQQEAITQYWLKSEKF